MSREHLTPRAVFGVPLILGVLNLIGLTGALLADGLWDWLGAGLLGVSVVAIAWARLRPPDQARSP